MIEAIAWKYRTGSIDPQSPKNPRPLRGGTGAGARREGGSTEGDDPEHRCDGALLAVAARHGMGPNEVAELRRQRAAITAATALTTVLRAWVETFRGAPRAA